MQFTLHQSTVVRCLVDWLVDVQVNWLCLPLKESYMIHQATIDLSPVDWDVDWSVDWLCLFLKSSKGELQEIGQSSTVD